MGYTHYWDGPGSDAEGFGKTLLDAKLIIEDQAEHLRGGLGDGDPVLNEGEVRFNGDGSKGLDYETFVIEAGTTGFNFCKTRCSFPYGGAVTAVLIRYAKHVPGANVRSDGEWSDPEWQAGQEICQRLFGEADKPAQVDP